jgi:predicted enzyme related to lactoylglutathione lyase
MSLEVDDIEAMTAKIKAAGSDVGEVHDFPNCRAMFFKDPEGNNLSLHQRKS